MIGIQQRENGKEWAGADEQKLCFIAGGTHSLISVPATHSTPVFFEER